MANCFSKAQPLENNNNIADRYTPQKLELEIKIKILRVVPFKNEIGNHKFEFRRVTPKKWESQILRLMLTLIFIFAMCLSFFMPSLILQSSIFLTTLLLLIGYKCKSLVLRLI
jgi:hypothetical protein